MTPFEPQIDLFGTGMLIQLPEDCMHLMSVWKTKKAAREWFKKKDISFIEVKEFPIKED